MRHIYLDGPSSLDSYPNQNQIQKNMSLGQDPNSRSTRRLETSCSSALERTTFWAMTQILLRVIRYTSSRASYIGPCLSQISGHQSISSHPEETIIRPGPIPRLICSPRLPNVTVNAIWCPWPLYISQDPLIPPPGAKGPVIFSQVADPKISATL